MIFNVNQTEFSNKFQKDIWELGKTVLPLEITLAGIDDSEMREGCTQIYNFSQELLEDMYNNPEKYEGRDADTGKAIVSMNKIGDGFMSTSFQDPVSVSATWNLQLGLRYIF